MSKKALSFTAALVMVSCSSAEKDQSSLDIGMEKPSSQSLQMNELEDSKVRNVDSNSLNSETKVSVNPDQGIEWEKYFKPPPTSGDFKLVESRIDKWSKSSNPEIVLKRAHNEFSVGKFARSEASFREVLRQDEGNIEALLGLSQLFLKKRDLPQVFEFLAQIKKHIGPDENIDRAFLFKYRYTLAVSYIQKGNSESGHMILSDLIAVDSKFAPAYAALSSSYLANNKLKMAEFIAKRGLDQIKDDIVLLNLLGVIAEKNDRNADARSWYDKALKINPNFTEAMVNRAGLSIKSYEYNAAEQDLMKSIVLDPLSSEAFTSLGIVQQKTGRMKAARASFVRAIEIDPENAVARLNLAVLYADHFKNSDKALRLFHEVVQTNSPNNQAKSLAKVYIQSIRDQYLE